MSSRKNNQRQNFVGLEQIWQHIDPNKFWLFAYGSLMWQPEFESAEKHLACLSGYHRSFCLYSTDYRGTQENPGLLLGLQQGESCWGVAYRVERDRARSIFELVWQREMFKFLYHPLLTSVSLQCGQKHQMLAFIANGDNPDYVDNLSLEQQANLILQARGYRGDNWTYFWETWQCLQKLGIEDLRLRQLAETISSYH
jgi:cation transport protein ChaC